MWIPLSEFEFYFCNLFCLRGFGTRSSYVAQAGVELKILLHRPPQCWDFRPVPPHLAKLCFGDSPIVSNKMLI